MAVPSLKINRPLLAELFGVTERRIRQLQQDGLPIIKAKNGRITYDLREVIPWIRARDQKPGSAREDEIRARTEGILLDNAVKRGHLISSEYHEAVTDMLCKAFVDAINAIGPRLEHDLSQERLADELRDARDEVAAALLALPLPETMGQDSEESAEADDSRVGRAGKTATQ